MGNLQRLLRMLILLACFGVLCAACGTSPPEPGDQSNQPAYLHSPLTTLSGETLHLGDLQGQLVLINFWATWCAPCRKEMPDLDAYYREHRDDGFVLLAVNTGEPAERVAEFIADYDFAFTIILDESGQLGDQFGGIRAMPTSFLLDGDGRLIQPFLGIIQPELLASEVTPLLVDE